MPRMIRATFRIPHDVMLMLERERLRRLSAGIPASECPVSGLVTEAITLWSERSGR